MPPASEALQQPYSLAYSYAYSRPQRQAVIRCRPTDFKVDEDLGFVPSGEGEHWYLHVEKTGTNTLEVVQAIARLFKVRKMDVGYCGLKDRHAVTRQWFSVYCPKGGCPSADEFSACGLTLLDQGRHSRKLRRGSHRANRFQLKLRSLAGDMEGLDSQLETIAQYGVPNYFGPQRFGIEANNLRAADRMADGYSPRSRAQRGLYLSAARSYLFNSVLSARVAADTWRIHCNGDVDIAKKVDDVDEGSDLVKHPTGPLWGRGRLSSTGDLLESERQLAEQFPQWCHMLEHAGLHQERRLLVLKVGSLAWQLGVDDMGEYFSMSFELPPGAYATSALREIFDYRVASAHGGI